MRDQGFAEFVEAELPGLLGYARALTGNEHDAWDLAQEALVRVGLKWPRVHRGSNPVGYARTTLARLNIDRLRRRRRESLSGSVPEIPVEPLLPDGVEAWLVEALVGLSPKQRTAVVLRCVDDLDAAGSRRCSAARSGPRAVISPVGWNGCATPPRKEIPVSEPQPEDRVVTQVSRYAVPHEPPYGLAEAVIAEVARRRRRRAVLGSVAAAAVVIAGSLGVARVLPEGDDRLSEAADRSGVPSAPEGRHVPVGGDWRAMATSPLSPRHASLGVWTGEEMVVVGGRTGFVCPPTADCLANGKPSTEAAAYDPTTDTWRRLPDTPAPVADGGPVSASGDAITWTGQEVVVVHGDELFALAPDAGAWESRHVVTELSDLPPSEGDAPMLVHASYDKGRGAQQVDWVLDPVTGKRTWLPADPFGESYDRSIAWDGERFWLLSMAVEQHFGAHEPRPSRLAVLEGARWRVVDDETPGVVYGQRMQWADGRLVIPPQADADGRWFDPTTEEWGTLPATGSESACPIPAAGPGSRWLASQGGVLVAGDEVRQVPACEEVFAAASVAVWAGEELIAWGGAEPGSNLGWRVTGSGLRWLPPAPR